MKNYTIAFKKRKSFFSLILVLVGLTASAIVTKKFNFFSGESSDKEITATCLVVNYPAIISVDEAFNLSASRAIQNPNGVNTAFMWALTAGGDGYAEFGNGESTIIGNNPSLIAKKPGTIKLTVFHYDEALRSDAIDVCDRQNITQTVSISVVE